VRVGSRQIWCAVAKDQEDLVGLDIKDAAEVEHAEVRK
jgi:hypothetical protein